MSYQKINLTMLTDFYELTMAGGYFEEGMKNDIATFDIPYKNTNTNPISNIVKFSLFGII